MSRFCPNCDDPQLPCGVQTCGDEVLVGLIANGSSADILNYNFITLLNYITAVEELIGSGGTEFVCSMLDTCTLAAIGDIPAYPEDDQLYVLQYDADNALFSWVIPASSTFLIDGSGTLVNGSGEVGDEYSVDVDIEQTTDGSISGENIYTIGSTSWKDWGPSYPVPNGWALVYCSEGSPRLDVTDASVLTGATDSWPGQNTINIYGSVDDSYLDVDPGTTGTITNLAPIGVPLTVSVTSTSSVATITSVQIPVRDKGRTLPFVSATFECFTDMPSLAPGADTVTFVSPDTMNLGSPTSLVPGQIIDIGGTVSNDGRYTIDTVSGDNLTITFVEQTIVAEGPVAVTVTPINEIPAIKLLDNSSVGVQFDEIKHVHYTITGGDPIDPVDFYVESGTEVVLWLDTPGTIAGVDPSDGTPTVVNYDFSGDPAAVIIVTAVASSCTGVDSLEATVEIDIAECLSQISSTVVATSSIPVAILSRVYISDPEMGEVTIRDASQLTDNADYWDGNIEILLSDGVSDYSASVAHGESLTLDQTEHGLDPELIDDWVVTATANSNQGSSTETFVVEPRPQAHPPYVAAVSPVENSLDPNFGSLAPETQATGIKSGSDNGITWEMIERVPATVSAGSHASFNYALTQNVPTYGLENAVSVRLSAERNGRWVFEVTDVDGDGNDLVTVIANDLVGTPTKITMTVLTGSPVLSDNDTTQAQATGVAANGASPSANVVRVTVLNSSEVEVFLSAATTASSATSVGIQNLVFYYDSPVDDADIADWYYNAGAYAVAGLREDYPEAVRTNGSRVSYNGELYELANGDITKVKQANVYTVTTGDCVDPVLPDTDLDGVYPVGAEVNVDSKSYVAYYKVVTGAILEYSRHICKPRESVLARSSSDAVLYEQQDLDPYYAATIPAPSYTVLNQVGCGCTFGTGALSTPVTGTFALPAGTNSKLVVYTSNATSFTSADLDLNTLSTTFPDGSIGEWEVLFNEDFNIAGQARRHVVLSADILPAGVGESGTITFDFPRNGIGSGSTAAGIWNATVFAMDNVNVKQMFSQKAQLSDTTALTVGTPYIVERTLDFGRTPTNPVLMFISVGTVYNPSSTLGDQTTCTAGASCSPNTANDGVTVTGGAAALVAALQGGSSNGGNSAIYIYEDDTPTDSYAMVFNHGAVTTAQDRVMAFELAPLYLAEELPTPLPDKCLTVDVGCLCSSSDVVPTTWNASGGLVEAGLAPGSDIEVQRYVDGVLVSSARLNNEGSGYQFFSANVSAIGLLEDDLIQHEVREVCEEWRLLTHTLTLGDISQYVNIRPSTLSVRA